VTPEQQALIEKSQRSLEAAQGLVQQGFHDFAVSRAYYAMFYVTEALLDHEGLSFSSHSAVISAFGLHLARPEKIPSPFHRYLIDAQAQRTRADYDPQPDLVQADAELVIHQAQEFLVIAIEYLS
jgi:uncharacterized protein (UPF0332 family)